MLTQTGTCTCGTEVRRPLQVSHRFAQMLAELPVVCDECIARADAEDAAADERARAERRRAAHEARRARSGIPDRLLGIRLDELDCDSTRRAAIDAARACAVGSLQALTLIGPPGTGKTSIAAGIASAVLERRGLRWISAPTLMARVSASFGSDQHADALEILTSRTPLILDDLDKAKPTEHAAGCLFAAIDERISHGALLVITSNLSPNRLAARWPSPHGEAIVSRLLSGRVCEVSGHDRRLAPATPLPRAGREAA